MEATSRQKSVKQENINAPASFPQVRALYTLTTRLGLPRQDFRNMGLTRGVASEMIAKLVQQAEAQGIERAPKKETTQSKREKLEKEFAHFMETETLPKVVAMLKKALGIHSIVKNDTNFVKDDGKRYNFFGFGCGITYIEYDKRSKIAKTIDEIEGKYRKTFNNKAIMEIPAQVRGQLHRMGSPIEAILYQDVEIQRVYYTGVMDFMEKHNVKGLRLINRLD